MHVSVRATFVARIFDVVAWVILGIGVVFGGLAFLAGLFGLFGDSYAYSLSLGIFMLVTAAIYTAISWASIALAAVVAGYIAQKSE